MFLCSIYLETKELYSLIQRCRAGRLLFFVRAPGPCTLVLWRVSF